METGLFEIQAEHLRDCRQNRQLLSDSRDVIHTVFRRADSLGAHAVSLNTMSDTETVPDSGMKADLPAVEFAH
jgi:hypothetical protein